MRRFHPYARYELPVWERYEHLMVCVLPHDGEVASLSWTLFL